MPVIRYLNKVHFGDGVFEHALEVELRALGVARPLVVLDGPVAASGPGVRLESALTGTFAAVFFETRAPLPTRPECLSAAERYRAHGCDGIVGFGSPEAIDLAKVTGLRVSHGEELMIYAAAEGGTSRIRDSIPPVLAVPVGAGTGSEVDGVVKIRLDDGSRQTFASPALLPKVAILDPTLTVELSGATVAVQAARTLLRCFETYLASPFNPPADGLALDGLRRCWRWLDAATGSTDLDARREMMAAAFEGGLAAQKGVGIGHALVDALVGLAPFRVDPGRLAAALLPRVLEFNRPAVGDRFSDLAKAVEVGGADGVAPTVARRLERVGLAGRVADAGLSMPEIVLAAERAEADCAHRTNPRRARVEELIELVLASL